MSAPDNRNVLQPSRVLLTTADRQIENFTHGTDATSSFEDSLYEAVLFHDAGVLPDIFTFISSALASKQSSPKPLHIESAIEAGLIVPAFRGNAKTFSESLALIENQKIQG